MNANLNTNQIATFGDARRMILDTIVELRSGNMDATRGLAIAANMKVLNDSVQVEINAAKLAIATEGKAFNFGKVIGLGQRLLANSAGQEA